MDTLQRILWLISAGRRGHRKLGQSQQQVWAENIRAAEFKLNFHLTYFCSENGSSMFTRTVVIHSVSSKNAALSGTATPRPLSVPTWLLKGRSVHLPVTLSLFLQATILYAAPPLVLFLASHPGVLPKYLQSLRYVASRAAPLGGLDTERFLKKVPLNTGILQGSMRLLLWEDMVWYIC